MKSFLLEVVNAEHYDEQNIEDDAKDRTVEKRGKVRIKLLLYSTLFNTAISATSQNQQSPALMLILKFI